MCFGREDVCRGLSTDNPSNCRGRAQMRRHRSIHQRLITENHGHGWISPRTLNRDRDVVYFLPLPGRRPSGVNSIPVFFELQCSTGTPLPLAAIENLQVRIHFLGFALIPHRHLDLLTNNEGLVEFAVFRVPGLELFQRLRIFPFGSLGYPLDFSLIGRPQLEQLCWDGRIFGVTRRPGQGKQEEENACHHFHRILKAPRTHEEVKCNRVQGSLFEKEFPLFTLSPFGPKALCSVQARRPQTARDFLFHPLGSLPAEGPGSVGVRGEVGGVQGHRGQELPEFSLGVNVFQAKRDGFAGNGPKNRTIRARRFAPARFRF
jgi:hypothetical protein